MISLRRISAASNFGRLFAISSRGEKILDRGRWVRGSGSGRNPQCGDKLNSVSLSVMGFSAIFMSLFWVGKFVKGRNCSRYFTASLFFMQEKMPRVIHTRHCVEKKIAVRRPDINDVGRAFTLFTWWSRIEVHRLRTLCAHPCHGARTRSLRRHRSRSCCR